MTDENPPIQIQPKPRPFLTPDVIAAGVIVVVIAATIVALRYYYPVGVDWHDSFSRAFRHWRAPHEIATYAISPWAAFFLPHGLLPIEWGNAINLLLNIAVPLAVIRKYNGGWQAMVLTFTSPLFFDLARTNNVEWIPLLSFLLPTAWALPVLAAKPTTLGGAALIWWKKEKFSIKVLLPAIFLVLFSFVFWGFWPDKIQWEVVKDHWNRINFAPWPIAIPLGLYMLYRAFQTEDEILGAAATPFLVPYFSAYSLVPVITLVSCRYKREGLYLWIAFWLFVFVEGRRFNLY
jgi:hypothetical protein